MKKSQKSKVKSQNYNAKGKNFTFLLAVFTSYFLLLPSFSSAQPVSSTELISNAKAYDGRVIAYAGEVIGDIMARGDFAWVNIHDGQYAIGVWMSRSLSAQIIYAGSYKTKGDFIEVVGIFNRSCPQHGGDLDIHAQGMRKLSSGRPVTEKLNTGKKNLSLVLLGVLCLILILRQLKRA